MNPDSQTNNLEEIEETAAEQYFAAIAAKVICDMEDQEFGHIVYDETEYTPPLDTIEKLERSVQSYMKRASLVCNVNRGIRKAGRFIAVFVLTCCVVLTVTYTTVRAARVSINNFFLEHFDQFSIIHTNPENPGNASITEDPRVPAPPQWVPERFILSDTIIAANECILIFSSSEDGTASIDISYSWSGNVAIDTENATVEEIQIQGVPATLLYKESANTYFVIFVKNDIVVSINGMISKEEIIKIAENLNFS